MTQGIDFDAESFMNEIKSDGSGIVPFDGRMREDGRYIVVHDKIPDAEWRHLDHLYSIHSSVGITGYHISKLSPLSQSFGSDQRPLTASGV